MIEWRRIYVYPFTQQSHAFIDGHGCCGKARRDVGRMQRTIAPTSALDTCAECAKWLRERDAIPAPLPKVPAAEVWRELLRDPMLDRAHDDAILRAHKPIERK